MYFYIFVVIDAEEVKHTVLQHLLGRQIIETALFRQNIGQVHLRKHFEHPLLGYDESDQLVPPGAIEDKATEFLFLLLEDLGLDLPAVDGPAALADQGLVLLAGDLPGGRGRLPDHLLDDDWVAGGLQELLYALQGSQELLLVAAPLLLLLDEEGQPDGLVVHQLQEVLGQQALPAQVLDGLPDAHVAAVVVELLVEGLVVAVHDGEQALAEQVVGVDQQHRVLHDLPLLLSGLELANVPLHEPDHLQEHVDRLVVLAVLHPEHGQVVEGGGQQDGVGLSARQVDQGLLQQGLGRTALSRLDHGVAGEHQKVQR